MARRISPQNARDSLIALLNQELVFARKPFGMYAQIQWRVAEVDRDTIVVAITTSREVRDPIGLATNVRNALVNILQDILPVRRFRAVYTNPTTGAKDLEIALPFPSSAVPRTPLPSSLILIEQHAGPYREHLRPRARAAWQAAFHRGANAPD